MKVFKWEKFYQLKSILGVPEEYVQKKARGSRETSKEISAIKELNCHGGGRGERRGKSKIILKEKLKYVFDER